MSNLLYVPKCLAVASLPHRAFRESEWRRTSGDFLLRVIAGNNSLVPSGSYARLFAMWLVTQIILTQKPLIETNESLHAILKSIGLKTDGRTRRRFKDQAARLLSCSMSMFRNNPAAHPICSDFDVHWNHRLPDNPSLSIFKSSFQISAPFFDHVMSSAFPVKKDAVIALHRSSFCLDIYPWLSHRMSYNRADTPISFESLEPQFGCRFKRHRDFRPSFRRHLATVSRHYPEARTSFYCDGLILHPSMTAVPRTTSFS